MQSKNTVNVEHHALDTLRFIRASMESASSLIIQGQTGYIVGAIGLSAFVLTQFDVLQRYWIVIWMMAATIAFSFGWLALNKQTLGGAKFFTGPARRFFLCLCPGLVAGAVLTGILLLHDQQQYLAGTWLLLYGCAVISASAMTHSIILRYIASMGALFVLLGSVTFELPLRFHSVSLGLGFGVLHVIFGVLIGRVHHE